MTDEKDRATPRQIIYLQERGIYHPPNVTKAEATEIITQYQVGKAPEDEQHLMDID